jgi:hypothetical protein
MFTIRPIFSTLLHCNNYFRLKANRQWLWQFSFGITALLMGMTPLIISICSGVAIPVSVNPGTTVLIRITSNGSVLAIPFTMASVALLDIAYATI